MSEPFTRVYSKKGLAFIGIAQTEQGHGWHHEGNKYILSIDTKAMHEYADIRGFTELVTLLECALGSLNIRNGLDGALIENILHHRTHDIPLALHISISKEDKQKLEAAARHAAGLDSYTSLQK